MNCPHCGMPKRRLIGPDFTIFGCGTSEDQQSPACREIARLKERVRVLEEEKAQTCEWHYDDGEYAGYWECSCGCLWTLEDGGPVENNMTYCPKCGKRIAIAGGKGEG